MEHQRKNLFSSMTGILIEDIQQGDVKAMAEYVSVVAQTFVTHLNDLAGEFEHKNVPAAVRQQLHRYSQKLGEVKRENENLRKEVEEFKKEGDRLNTFRSETTALLALLESTYRTRIDDLLGKGTILEQQLAMNVQEKQNLLVACSNQSSAQENLEKERDDCHRRLEDTQMELEHTRERFKQSEGDTSLLLIELKSENSRLIAEIQSLKSCFELERLQTLTQAEPEGDNLNVEDEEAVEQPERKKRKRRL
jgi:chromosome segregation ATPase